MKQVRINERLLTLRRALVEEIIALRNDVIIAGTDRDTPFFDADRDSTTRHYGAFAGDDCIGALSLMLNEWVGAPAWQLRGMATRDNWRGSGVGRRLLAFALEDTSGASGVSQFWCNARTSAATFYERFGWKRVSDEFKIKGVGPHFKMTIEVKTPV